MMRAKFVLLTLLCALPISSETVDRYERFRLFNACQPMELVIEGMGTDEAAIGLTENALQAAAESRLRAARLYTGDSKKADYAYLYVHVSVVGRAHSVRVRYKKMVTDAFGESFPATTWHIGGIGTHGGDAGFIMSFLSQQLDQFLAEYLRVNEAACESR